jgi:hypothetical protein
LRPIVGGTGIVKTLAMRFEYQVNSLSHRPEVDEKAVYRPAWRFSAHYFREDFSALFEAG